MIPEKQKLSYAKCIEILESGESGILSMKGLDEFPYAIPVNYVLMDHKIYIHGKPNGTKIQNIENDAHICFCVIERAEVIPEEYTTRFSSVIVYGTAKLLTSREEKYHAMQLLMHKFSPGAHAACAEALAHGDDPCLGIIEITPSQITGKKSRD